MKKQVYLLISSVLILSTLFYIYRKSLFTIKNSSKIKVRGNMYITSSAFENNEIIPTKYTCEGENVNPPLVFTGIPQNTKSLVLIIEDPDAPGGVWNHWIVYNINPNIREIKEGEVPLEGIEVPNSFGQKNYGGPCPPPGPAHRYFFKIYALDNKLNKDIKTKEQLLQEIQEHILDKGEIIGLYSR